MKWVLVTDRWTTQEFDVRTQHGYLSFIWWFFADAPGVQYSLATASDEIDWANAYWPDEANCKSGPITRLMHVIWSQRPDLGTSFDISTIAGRQSYIRWFLNSGKEELRLQNVLVPAWLGEQLPRSVKEKFKQGTKAILRVLAKDKHSAKIESCNSHDSPREFAQIRSVGVDGDLQGNGKGDLNVIGAFTGALSQGEHARNVARALKSSKQKMLQIDVILPGRTEGQTGQSSADFDGTNTAQVNLFCFNPDWFTSLPKNLCSTLWRNHFNISYGFWELNLIPEAWLSLGSLFDEIWAPSRFVMDCWKHEAPCHVEYMPIAVDFETVPNVSRSDYNLPDGEFLFLFNFDSMSYIRRKNPLAVIKAFDLAFPSRSEKTGLVIKAYNIAASVAGGTTLVEELAELQKRALQDPRIRLIDEYYSRDKMTGLMKSCDAYISLHRAEGFGLGMAESMLLGKPVIATGYSGNMDFTLPTNSCLVDYKLMPVREKEYPYYRQGQVWAEPNIEHAASYMRRLYDDPDYALNLGQSAQEYMKQNHNSAVIGKKYSQRLAEIGKLSIPKGKV